MSGPRTLTAGSTGLVGGRTSTTLRGCREASTQSIECLIHGHVRILQHRFETFEKTSAGEVATVEYDTHVSPFGIHRTRSVDWCYHLDLTASGVIPDDLHEIVSVDCYIGVTLVAYDRGQQGVVDRCYRFPSRQIDLQHRIINLRLLVEFIQLFVGILPDNVSVVLRVDVNRRPVAILLMARDREIVDYR